MSVTTMYDKEKFAAVLLGVVVAEQASADDALEATEAFEVEASLLAGLDRPALILAISLLAQLGVESARLAGFPASLIRDYIVKAVNSPAGADDWALGIIEAAEKLAGG